MKYLIFIITILGVLTLSGCALINTADNNLPPESQGDRPPTGGDQNGTIPQSMRLDLSNRNLDKVPMDIFNRTNLVELDVSGNNLTGALPAEIRKLQNLKVLKANNNNMTGVPAEIGQLRKLEVLDLSNNQLTGLPYELGNLKNLKTFNLSGNNYSTLDLERIREDLPNTNFIL
ncbi:MAG: leucine-rich repeat domain-containing protein [Patescibacteria group bacterium]